MARYFSRLIMVMKKISKSLNQLKMIVAQTFAADNSTDDTSKDTKIERSLKRKKLMIYRKGLTLHLFRIRISRVKNIYR